MKTKTIALSFLTIAIILVSGCGKHDNKKKEVETINPFSPTSMVKTYDRSKVKINDAVQKENEHLKKSLKDGEME
ncbi:MAG TPA: hypothetical protein ENJ27_00010 [Candidatus Moranbacteria bacterium]|nr:hypothetical protein [Candidatus Moranbacteria bacterium]